MNTKDNALIKAIETCQIDSETLLQVATWHEDASITSPWWDETTSQKDKTRDKERHCLIAKALIKKLQVHTKGQS